MYLASDAAGTGRSQARSPSSPLEGLVFVMGYILIGFVGFVGFVGFRVYRASEFRSLGVRMPSVLFGVFGLQIWYMYVYVEFGISV